MSVSKCSSYHGNLSSLVDISAKSYKRLPQGKRDFVHVIPLPRSRNGGNETASNSLCNCEVFFPNAIIFYSVPFNLITASTSNYEQAKKVVERATANGRPIGCFISELAISAAGMIIPPPGYFKEIYQ